MGYKRLYKNLIDIIKEEQAKLGFRRESIRLYYPLSSLNHFFETQDTEEQMKNRLHGIPDFIKETLGDIKVTSKKERFCFYIPEEGSNYVHENTNPNEFIKELVEIVGKHGCKMEDIIALFKQHDKNVFVEEIHNGEFDYLIRFSEENEDPYYYCFHDEGCHIIYHCFLPEVRQECTLLLPLPRNLHRPDLPPPDWFPFLILPLRLSLSLNLSLLRMLHPQLLPADTP